MLCVGSHGNNLDLLVNLASFIAGMELFTVKSTRPQHFFEQARTAFRVAGSEGRQCVLLINVSNLKLKLLRCVTARISSHGYF